MPTSIPISVVLDSPYHIIPIIMFTIKGYCPLDDGESSLQKYDCHSLPHNKTMYTHTPERAWLYSVYHRRATSLIISLVVDRHTITRWWWAGRVFIHLSINTTWPRRKNRNKYKELLMKIEIVEKYVKYIIPVAYWLISPPYMALVVAGRWICWYLTEKYGTDGV